MTFPVNFSAADKAICEQYRLLAVGTVDTDAMKQHYPIYLKMLAKNGFTVNKYVMFLKKYLVCIPIDQEEGFASKSYYTSVSAINGHINTYKGFIESEVISNINIGQTNLLAALSNGAHVIQNIVRVGEITQSLYLETSLPTGDQTLFLRADVVDIGTASALPSILHGT